MTDHGFNFVRYGVYYASVRGPVLEIGSYVEANQDHLNLRKAFPEGTPYLGVDVIPSTTETSSEGETGIEVHANGVDRYGNLLEPEGMLAIAAEVQPKIILCLYVLEHVWEITKAAVTLGALWRQHPESWLYVSTHQNQPFHGTDKYPDYWRITGPGMKRLMDEAGMPNVHVFVHENSSNPEDIFAIQQPASMEWSDDIFKNAIRDTAHPPRPRWESY